MRCEAKLLLARGSIKEAADMLFNLGEFETALLLFGSLQDRLKVFRCIMPLNKNMDRIEVVLEKEKIVIAELVEDILTDKGIYVSSWYF